MTNKLVTVMKVIGSLAVTPNKKLLISRLTTNDRQLGSLMKDHMHDVGHASAQGYSNTDFTSSSGYGIGHHPVNAYS